MTPGIVPSSGSTPTAQCLKIYAPLQVWLCVEDHLLISHREAPKVEVARGRCFKIWRTVFRSVPGNASKLGCRRDFRFQTTARVPWPKR
eukprot:6474306-Pyramimonas_sp.AAC.1